MSLSQDAKQRLIIALASQSAGDEVAQAIDGVHIVNPAGNVPVLGATSNLPASNASLSTGDTYTDAAVKSAIDGAVDALRTPLESRLDAAEGKIDAIIAALVAAGLMSP